MKFSIFSIIYTLLLAILVFYSFAIRQVEITYDAQQRMYDLQVNYATDAATWLMLHETEDINIDYASGSAIMLDPQVALEAYEGVMVRSLGWSDDPTTRDFFEASYMPFFVVATYDGYYIYLNTHEQVTQELADGSTVTSDVYTKRWTPKLVWSEFDGDDYLNVYNLGDDQYDKYDIHTGEVTIVPYGDDELKERNLLVSKTLTQACDQGILAYNETLPDIKMFIPPNASVWTGNRPITGPSVLTYMDITNNTRHRYSTFALSVSKITETPTFVAYSHKVGGTWKKFYCDYGYVYSTPFGDMLLNGTDPTYRLDKFYGSQVDAARDGYTYNIDSLSWREKGY